MEPEEKKNVAQKAVELGKKYWELLCGAVSKKILIYCVIGVLLAVCALCGCAYATNNYRTPIRQAQKLSNMSGYDVEKAGIEALNKVGSRRWKKILEIMHGSDDYLDALKEAEKTIERNYESNLDTYGEDYKLELREVEKLELTKYELRDYRRRLQTNLNNIEDLVDMAEEFTSEEWREFADELGLSKRDAKELVAEYGILLEDLGRLQVTAGYEVTLEKVITGELVEEPTEATTEPVPTDETATVETTEEAEEKPKYETVTMIVLKVNGRWVQFTSFASAYSPLSFA